MEKGLLARIIFTKGFRIVISGLKQLKTRSGGIREYLTLRLAFFYQRPKNLREKKDDPVWDRLHRNENREVFGG